MLLLKNLLACTTLFAVITLAAGCEAPEAPEYEEDDRLNIQSSVNILTDN